MKHTLSLLIALMSFSWVVAQDDPAKDLKKVSRIIANYNLDPNAHSASLPEAASLIESIVGNSAFEKDHKAWLLYGNTFGELVNQQTQVHFLDPLKGTVDGSAVHKTLKGYQNALNYAQKGYEKKDAVNGLQGYLPNMFYIANIVLGGQDYEGAYYAFNSVVEAETLVRANGGSGSQQESELRDTRFVVAVCAATIGKYDEAISVLEGLQKDNYNDAGVYEYLYKAYAGAGKADQASAILQEGRKKHPGDKGLLFAEINEALGKGDLESLVGKLKEAMQAEPDNISVPTTLGNVYDQLYQKSLAEGNKEVAHQHFESAREYVSRALAINPSHFEAVYMMGALEYNRAVEYATEVNELADDYTREGTKKYEAKQKEMVAQFDRALPHFEKAEMLNPDDTNTLLALREIWARKGDFEKSNQYKEKLERIIGN